MKAARVRVTTELLSTLLGLPKETEIIAACQDADDIFSRSVSFVIRGAGEECLEGSAVKVKSLSDIQDDRWPTATEMAAEKVIRDAELAANRNPATLPLPSDNMTV